MLTLHRADFQRVLAQRAIPPARPHFGKRLVDYVCVRLFLLLLLLLLLILMFCSFRSALLTYHTFCTYSFVFGPAYVLCTHENPSPFHSRPLPSPTPPTRWHNSEDPTTGELTLRFTDGTRAVCDVLVGADGIRSVTRGVMYRRLVHAGVVRLPEAASVSVLPAGGANGNGKVDGKVHVESSKMNGTANGTTTTTEGGKEEEKEEAETSPPPSPRTPLDPVADFIDPVWSGTLVYRALIPKAVLDATWPGHRVCEGPVCVSLPSFLYILYFFLVSFSFDAKEKTESYVSVRQYFGKSKHVLAFPIMHTAPAPAPAPPSEPGATAATTTTPATTPATTTTPMINLVAFTSQPHLEGTRIDGAWVRPAPAANLLGEFAGWEGEVRALLGLVRDPLLWAIHTVRPLPRFSDGRRVVLLGDAVRFCSSFFIPCLPCSRRPFFVSSLCAYCCMNSKLTVR